MRDGSLERITRDHTLVQSLIDAGRLTEHDAATHPQRNVLTRVLDGPIPPRPTCRSARSRRATASCCAATACPGSSPQRPLPPPCSPTTTLRTPSTSSSTSPCGRWPGQHHLCRRRRRRRRRLTLDTEPTLSWSGRSECSATHVGCGCPTPPRDVRHSWLAPSRDDDGEPSRRSRLRVLCPHGRRHVAARTRRRCRRRLVHLVTGSVLRRHDTRDHRRGGRSLPWPHRPAVRRRPLTAGRDLNRRCRRTPRVRAGAGHQCHRRREPRGRPRHRAAARGGGQRCANKNPPAGCPEAP